MQISVLNYSNYYQAKQQSFGSAFDKLITKIKFCTNPKKTHITYDEARKIYEKLGCKIINQPGSHTIITMPDGFNFPLVIPHGNEKHIKPDSVKVLRAAIVGDMRALKHAVYSSNLH